MARLAPLDRADLSPEGQRVWDMLVGARGGIRGPNEVWIRVPQLAEVFAGIGTYLRSGETVLSDHDREVAVLAIAAACDSPFEWWLHEPIARRAGVRSEAIETLRDGTDIAALGERERVLVDVARALVSRYQLDESLYRKTLDLLGERAFIELVAAIGFYIMTACALGTFSILPPEMPRMGLTSKPLSTNGRVEVSDAVLDRLAPLPTATIYDAMTRNLGLPGAVMFGMKRLTGEKMVGRARTMERIIPPLNAPADFFDGGLKIGMPQIVDAAGPRSVLVIAARGNATRACFGGGLAVRASRIGMAGVVVDGAVRDLRETEDAGLVTFAVAASPAAGLPGEAYIVSVNQPVVCDSLLVNPDDVLVGDEDGVVVIPSRHAVQVVETAEELAKAE